MIRLNNRDEVAWEEGLTVAALLEQMRYTYPHVIVTIGGQVVHTEAYETCLVPDGADVRVIHLIAGG